MCIQQTGRPSGSMKAYRTKVIKSVGFQFTIKHRWGVFVKAPGINKSVVRYPPGGRSA